MTRSRSVWLISKRPISLSGSNPQLKPALWRFFFRASNRTFENIHFPLDLLLAGFHNIKQTNCSDISPTNFYYILTHWSTICNSLVEGSTPRHHVNYLQAWPHIWLLFGRYEIRPLGWNLPRNTTFFRSSLTTGNLCLWQCTLRSPIGLDHGWQHAPFKYSPKKAPLFLEELLKRLLYNNCYRQ